LRYLNCNLTKTDLITLPQKLEFLDCSYSATRMLPQLPPTLKTLWCGWDSLTQLPLIPNGVVDLGVGYNQITNLGILPDSLSNLFCDNNLITTLPTLPNKLKILSCNSNPIPALPVLNDSLTDLYCNDNLLTSLPLLPAGLKILKCSSNQLDSLPNIPNTLTVLNCNDNQLTALPALPQVPFYLNCSHNQLTGLPPLYHKMMSLNISYNPGIKCLPLIDTLLGWVDDSMDLSHTGIHCLLDSIKYWSIYPNTSIDNLPICNSSYDPDSCMALVGVSEFSEGQISLYPNPAYNRATFIIPKNQNVTITICNITGKIIWEKQISTNEIEIDLTDFSNGIYLINLNTEKSSFCKRLVKLN
jgi:hypothetical protein